MKTIKHIYRAGFRQLQRITVVISLVTISAVAWSLITDALVGKDETIAATNTGEAGWGSETLDAAYEPWSLFPLANACGLGASSCFKCHNGKRAKKWDEKLETAPWHPNHKKVNFSCAGCHKGNPRLLKKSLAHRKLIGNPRTTPSESCAKCHQGDDITKLLKPYIAIGGTK